MSADELLKLARALPAQERLALAEALLDELDRTDAEIDAAWAAEAKDRLEAYRRGEIQAIPLEEVLAKYRAR